MAEEAGERRPKEFRRAHVLGVPYPTQGHINPMIQFCKCLASRGIKVTFAITIFVASSNSFNSPSNSGRPSPLHFDTISDGFDVGGFAEAGSIADYLSRFEAAGSESLAVLLRKHADSGHPVDCVVYDSFLPWALDVAKQYGAIGASFFTQACAVNSIYYYLHHGLLKLPISSPPAVIPGLPPLEIADMPGFVGEPGSYPAYFRMCLKQFSNLDEADFVLVNTCYELEAEVMDSMGKLGRVLSIGPAIPSFYLNNTAEDDKVYGLNLLEPSSCSRNWLATKPPGSVVYVSFGSLISLPDHQIHELAWALKATNFYFLWAIKTSEEEAKLPDGFTIGSHNKGLIIEWSLQLEVLADKAIGCFVSHCGWNSTLEALTLGVPVVALPLWTDQPTNAKLIQDVWRVGVRMKTDDKGVATRDEVEACIRRVMEGEPGKEMKANAIKWGALAKEAASKGGSSDKNINQFLSELC